MESIFRWLKQLAGNIFFSSFSPVSVPTCDDTQEVVKDDLGLCNIITDYERILDETEREVALAKDLQDKHGKVLKMCRMYTSILRHRDLDIDDDMFLGALFDVNDEFYEVVDTICDMHDEFRDMQLQLDMFTSMLRSHWQKIRQYLRDIQCVKTMEEFKQISIPTSDWISDHGVPPIHLLVQEWEEMELEERMTENLAVLRNLIPACSAA